MKTYDRYLISEAAVETRKPIILPDKGDGITRIKVILQDGDVPNRNKRIYKLETLKEAIKSPYIKERLETKSLYGEAGHPLKPDMNRQLYLDQTRISHIITDLWFEGNKLWGIVEAAQTAVGRDFQGLIRQGSRVAFSMRGVGGVQESKGEYVEVRSPLTILTWDWVIHPSHPVAYMQNIISEDTRSMLLNTHETVLSESTSITNLDALNETAKATAINLYNDGMLMPLYKKEIKDYTTYSGKNYRKLTESFDNLDSTKDDIRMVTPTTIEITRDNTVKKLYLEDFIMDHMDNYLANLTIHTREDS